MKEKRNTIKQFLSILLTLALIIPYIPAHAEEPEQHNDMPPTYEELIQSYEEAGIEVYGLDELEEVNVKSRCPAKVTDASYDPRPYGLVTSVKN